VRLSAARALLGQSSPDAATQLARALDLDYGEEDGVSRNPEVHAALLRALVTEFAGHPVTLATLADERRLKEPSVALMVLAARSTPASPAAHRGPPSSHRSPPSSGRSRS